MFAVIVTCAEEECRQASRGRRLCQTEVFVVALDLLLLALPRFAHQHHMCANMFIPRTKHRAEVHPHTEAAVHAVEMHPRSRRLRSSKHFEKGLE